VPQGQALRDHATERQSEYVGRGPAQRVEHRGRVIDEILGAVRRLPASEHRPVRSVSRSSGHMGRVAGVPQIADSWPKTLLSQALQQALQQTFGPPEAGKRKHHDHE